MNEGTAIPPKKKQQIRKPTPRMIKTAEIMLENNGIVSTAMLQAGYSPNVAKNPQTLTRSQSFMMLLDSIGVNDAKLGQTLQDGLEATKTVIIGKDEDAFADQVADHPTRHKFLETGLRLRGLSKADTGMTVNFNNFTDEQRGKYEL